MGRYPFPLFLTFYASSWISNDWIIRTTGELLKNSSLEVVLAVSSLAGLCFFIVLKALTFFKRPLVSAIFIGPLWLALLLCYESTTVSFLASTLMALLLGEVVKWHSYSQVLNRFGPLSAERVLTFGVLAYELGTLTAAFTATLPFTTLSRGLEVVALIVIHVPFFMGNANEEPRVVVSAQSSRSTTTLLPWIVLMGIMAGFLKVSSDTGFKYAIRLSESDATSMVANFYFFSGAMTIGLWFLKRQRFFSMKIGHPEIALSSFALVQGLFGIAFLIGSLPILLPMAAFQRSVEKIFYQPTVQLLASGFSPGPQERLRRFHGTAFLGLGCMMGLLAFFLYKTFLKDTSLTAGISVLHLACTLGFFVVSGVFLKKLVNSLDEETRESSALGSSRPMAMLALLSPKHFMVHALIWSRKRGGFHTLPPEILQGLTVQGEVETVNSFYGTFPRMDEGHQLAIIRLAIFLDRKVDREFLLNLAEEKIGGSKRARRLAALHLVKVHGRVYRALLRRARGRNSPFKKVA